VSQAGSSDNHLTNSVELRHCREVAEFQACVDLQREVWGFSDADLIPVRIFVVASKIGGQVIGAFAGPTLVGFALSIPGARDGHTYLHSHMLAVREGYRNSGLGRRLKLAQRDEERLPQHRKAGRYRSALYDQSIRHLVLAITGRTADRSLHCRMVAYLRQSSATSGKWTTKYR
jgi:GNAT superfamily N-acetyltransferase